MRTDDLIAALSADTLPEPSPGRALPAAFVAGGLAAVILLFLTLRPRGDLADAIHSLHFLFKFVATLSLAIPAWFLARRLADPAATHTDLWRPLMLAPVLLVLAVGLEMWTVPQSAWASRLMGVNSGWCLSFVPIFSLPALVAILFALKRGAPTRPRLAGLIAGLAAGGLGAAVYAVHCTDDSPLFVTVWYGLGISFVAAAGAALGSRILRW